MFARIGEGFVNGIGVKGFATPEPPHANSEVQRRRRLGTHSSWQLVLLNHRTLELYEHAALLEHCLACRGGDVDALLMRVQANALRVDLAEEDR